MIILAVLAFAGGWSGLPDGFLWGNAFSNFLAPIVAPPILGAYTKAAGLPGGVVAPAFMLSAITTVVALIGIAIAWLFYIRNPKLPSRLAHGLRGFYQLLLRKFYIDELYNALISRPLFWIADTVLNRGVDAGLINAAVDGTGLGVEASGEGLRKTETGNLQSYALVYLAGAVAIAAYYVYLVMR
jgi:NADH-quinone oxidoreductase subunit L